MSSHYQISIVHFIGSSLVTKIYLFSAERQRIVLERAVKLREDRRLSQQRQQEDFKRKAAARRRFQENLARSQLLWEEQQALQSKRTQAAINDLHEESSTWINASNVDTKINNALFEEPGASTGLHTRCSEYWAFQTFVPSFKRFFTDEQFIRKTGNNKQEDDFHNLLQTRREQKHVFHRLLMENFLEASVGSGKERAEYQEILKEFLQPGKASDGIVESFRDHDEMIDRVVSIEGQMDEDLESLLKASGELVDDGDYDDEEEDGHDEGDEDDDGSSVDSDGNVLDEILDEAEVSEVKPKRK